MAKKSVAVLLSVVALSVGSAAIAPVAGADICGAVGGRHVDVGGCTPGVAGDAVDAAVAGAAVAGATDWARYGFPENYAFSLVPAFPGEQPCISPTGLPYYTPADAPCFAG